MTRFRYTDIGVLEYQIKDGGLYFKNTIIPYIETFSSIEESKLHYYLDKRNELLRKRNEIMKNLYNVESNINQLTERYSDILEKYPEYII